MKILLIGAGGREHALAWKLAQSPSVSELLVAPGSDGIARASNKIRCLAEIPATAVDQLLKLALDEHIGLTVVGPEAPLVAGLADRFREKGVTVFGPSAATARLEGSKAFAKDLMRRAGIPTAGFHVSEDPDEASRYVAQHPNPWVVKADGLASGKGVLMPPSPLPGPELLQADTANRIQIVSSKFGKKIVLEELLAGEEASLIGVADGARVVLLEPAQDHKRLGDGDTGPNTGGMGAYSPAPVATASVIEEARRRILEPTVRAMADERAPFIGALYAGLMITADGPKVLEYNVRFGDPEAQVILPRLRGDLAELLLAAAEGRLGGVSLAWDPRPCVCVVLAARGYPERPVTGQPITGLEAAMRVPGVQVFHAGTKRVNGRWVTAGGRVLNIVALGRDHAEAVRAAYEASDLIQFDGKQCRRDIGARAIAPQPRS